MTDKFFGRLDALTSEQRALLEARIKKKGLSLSQSADPREREPHHSANEYSSSGVGKRADLDRHIKFSLYFFSDDGSSSESGKYVLLLESAKFADRNGFSAVWTPERHFQRFGGLYPNPSVLGAALAVTTERVGIRAGSVALPLHHPLRVAEEWSVVDNLSGGRVAVSFASGWHPDDFIFAPGIYEKRKDVMFDYIDRIQRLWAGEEVMFEGINGSAMSLRSLPRPIQASLPIWITTAGSPATWAKAGEIGANILCALVGYSYDDLAEHIGVYRKAREQNGHYPSTGQVTVMVHTYIGDDPDAVKAMVREPMYRYLRSYFQQFTGVVQGGDIITEEDKMAIVARAFDSYYEDGLLIGTKRKCERVIDRLIEAGADELACLVDFGLDFDAVMQGLERLADLQDEYARPRRSVALAAPGTERE